MGTPEPANFLFPGSVKDRLALGRRCRFGVADRAGRRLLPSRCLGRQQSRDVERVTAGTCEIWPKCELLHICFKAGLLRCWYWGLRGPSLKDNRRDPYFEPAGVFLGWPATKRYVARLPNMTTQHQIEIFAAVSAALSAELKELNAQCEKARSTETAQSNDSKKSTTH
jgi:hypothetical protein